MDFLDYIKQHPFDSELNPFNKKFNKESLKEKIEEKSLNADDFLQYVLLGNAQYKALLIYLESLKNEKQLPYYFIIAITLFNHDYILLSQEMNKQLSDIQTQNDGVRTSLDYQKVKIQTPLSDFSLMAFSDAFTETLDLMFSFFRSINGIPEKLPHLTDKFFLQNETFDKLHYYSERFNLLKNLYERVSFEKLIINKIDSGFYMKDLYDDYSLYRQLGFHRTEQNVKANLQNMIPYSLKNRFQGKYEIDKIFLNENDEINITYKIKDSNNPYLEVYLKYFLATIAKYHYHLSEEFKDSLSLTAEIWSVLIYLTQEFIEQTKNVFQSYISNNNGIVPYSKYQFKIRSKDVVILIEKITGYEKSLILKKLKLFENSGYDSFWTNPLFKISDWIYISIHSLQTIIPVYLLDEWLKISYRDEYDKKGTLFEDFLKKEVKKLCGNKKFFANILEQKKYSYKDDSGRKHEEEIDFIWETKKCIVIAEVKCIDYPFTPRITNNHFQVLEKASNQIKRKMQFLEENKTLFKIQDYNKSILPCVILNYPCYSGLKINDIPVIDIGLLENYISVGGLGDCTIGLFYESMTIREKYYNNEDEFSNNIFKLLNDSPYLNQLKSRYKKVVKDLHISDKFVIKYDTYENVDYNTGENQ